MVHGAAASNVTILETAPGAVYRVLDAEGMVVDRIMWDGVSPYDVEAAFGPGATLVLEDGQ